MRLISGETAKDLDILILPLPVFCFALEESEAMSGASGSSSRSLILTWDRRMPICTYNSPLAFGSVLTVPFKFKDNTRTLSPMRRDLAEMVFLGPLVLGVSFWSAWFIFSRSFARSASSSLADPWEVPSRLIFLMAWSAVSLASLRILWASSLALRSSLSFC